MVAPPPLTHHALSCESSCMVCHRVGDNQPSQNQFRNFQYSRPQTFRISKISKNSKISKFSKYSRTSKIPKLPKISPKVPKFPKTSPLCFGKSCPLGLAILEILEFLDSKISKKFALMFWRILSIRPGSFGNVGMFGNSGNFENVEFLEILEIRKS